MEAFHILCLIIVGAAFVVAQFPFQPPNVPSQSCLTCTYLSDPADCKHSKKCYPGDSCFLGEVHEADNETYYIQYCYPEPGCLQMKSLVEQGNNELRGYHFNWISCCNTDDCNNMIPQP
ncbi:uncharacterized protein [Haliotis cracherodii]|uniref:uncharacterized protein n=1 Tax=Haliotis cracherodii TaxID=6455 RepID=UPI001EAFF0BC